MSFRSIQALLIVIAFFTSALYPATRAGAAVEASLLASVDSAVPGESFLVGVRMKIAPHWHTYWINPGESGAPSKVELSGPAGFEFGSIQWPLPKRIEVEGGVTFGYEDEVLLLIPVKAAKNLPSAGKVTLIADATWLVCKESCIEGGKKLNIDLPVAAHSKPANKELFDKWRAQLPMPPEKASEVLSKVEPAIAADGSPHRALSIHWRQPPKNVEWFPIATEAAAVDNVKISHRGELTQITYKPTVYKADQVPGGQLDSVLVYEDAKGQRRGIVVPFAITQKR